MASQQSEFMCLIHRYREQARSHSSDLLQSYFFISAEQAALNDSC
jgi:2-oxoglutarate dehydrogenase complex dehydrogenase (E1) component-like enzyme